MTYQINTLEKAISRLEWRSKNGWKFNQNDANAVNFLIDYSEDQKKQNLNDYSLFSKLYIFAYMEYLKKYKATVFDDIPQKELHKFLEKPLETHIKEFKDFLNLSDQYSLLESKSRQKTNGNTIVEKSNMNEVLDLVKNPVWDYQTVSENIITQINSAINEYK